MSNKSQTLSATQEDQSKEDFSDLGFKPAGNDDFSDLGFVESPKALMETQKVHIPEAGKMLEVPSFWGAGLVGHAARKNFFPELEDSTGETFKAVVRAGINSASSMASLAKFVGQKAETNPLESVSGVSGATVDKAYAPESDQIKTFGKYISENSDHIIDNFDSLRQNGFSIAGHEIVKADPQLFGGSFMQNPSWTRAIATVAEAVPSLITAYAVSRATMNPLAGMTGLGLLQGASQREEALKSGVSQDKANAIFVLSSVTNSLLAGIPLGRFLNNLNTTGTNIIEGALIQGLEQGVQQVWTNTIAKYGYDNTRNFLDGVVESVIAGAGSGGILGAFSAGGGKRLDKSIARLKEMGATDQDIEILQKSIVDDILKNSNDVNEVIKKRAIEIKGYLADQVLYKTTALDASATTTPKNQTLEDGSPKKNINPENEQVNRSQKDVLYQKFINRFQSIENLVTRAKALGAEVKPGEDPGVRAREYLGLGGKASVILEDHTFRILPDGKVENTGEGLQPILEDFNSSIKNVPLDEKYNDLHDYLVANRYLKDLQRPKSEFDPESIATPEQITQSEETMKDLSSKYGDLNSFDDAAKRIYEYGKRVLGMLVDSGNISEDQFNEIVKRNPHYVPFERVLGEDEPSYFPINKNRFSGARAPVKKIKGSEKQVHNVLESIVKNTYKILDSSERNNVARGVARLSDVLPEDVSPVKVDFKPINLSEADTGGDAKTIFRPSQFVPKGNVIEYFEGGKRKFMEVSDNVYEAMKGIGEQPLNWYEKILSHPANWLRTGVSSTPEFIIRNPIRDQFSAFIQTQVGFKPFIDPFYAISDIVKRSDIYYDWLASGGANSGFTELSRAGLKKTVNELTGKPNLLKDLNIISKLQDVSQLFEQATRLGIFRAAKAKGLSDVEAGFQSREGTLDFSRKGSQTKGINAITAYLNAGIQGFDKPIRTFQADPAGASLKALASITFPAIALYLKNKDDKDYKQIPRWQKDIFFVITKIPNSSKYFMLPKPPVIGQLFGSLPERFLEYMESKDKRAFDDFTKTFIESTVPVVGDGVDGLLPTGLKPLLEISANYDFFRERQIVPEYQKAYIPSERYSKYTTETAKKLSKAGLDKLGLSPANIEHLLKGYFGGSGIYALQGVDLIERGVNSLTGKENKPRKPIELSDVPLVKGFVTRSAESTPQALEDFRSQKDLIDQAYYTHRKMVKEHRREDANAFMKENPMIAKHKRVDSFNKKITGLTKDIDEIVAKDIPDQEKRERIKALEKKRLEIIIQANEFIKND